MPTPVSLQRDMNFVAVGGGVLDDGSKTIAPISIASASGRVKVSAIISGGGAGSVAIVTDGVTTVTNPTTIDFTSGATVTNLGGGVAGVAVTGGTGSGFQLPLTGAVNGANQTFTWSTAPNAITVDGTTLQATEQKGSVNWTGTTTTFMTVPPVNSIFAVA